MDSYHWSSRRCPWRRRMTPALAGSGAVIRSLLVIALVMSPIDAGAHDHDIVGRPMYVEERIAPDRKHNTDTSASSYPSLLGVPWLGETSSRPSPLRTLHPTRRTTLSKRSYLRLLGVPCPSTTISTRLATHSPKNFHMKFVMILENGSLSPAKMTWLLSPPLVMQLLSLGTVTQRRLNTWLYQYDSKAVLAPDDFMVFYKEHFRIPRKSLQWQRWVPRFAPSWRLA